MRKRPPPSPPVELYPLNGGDGVVSSGGNAMLAPEPEELLRRRSQNWTAVKEIAWIYYNGSVQNADKGEGIQ